MKQNQQHQMGFIVLDFIIYFTAGYEFKQISGCMNSVEREMQTNNNNSSNIDLLEIW